MPSNVSYNLSQNNILGTYTYVLKSIKSLRLANSMRIDMKMSYGWVSIRKLRGVAWRGVALILF